MQLDPFGIGSTFLKIQQAWLQHPREQLEAQHELAASLWMLNLHALETLVGARSRKPVEAAESDERFQDPEWQATLGNSLMVQHYLAYTRWLERTIYDTPGVDHKDSRAGAFWTRQWFNALAPSNFFFTNPVAMHKAMATRGASLAKGLENFMADLQAGDVQMMADAAAFTLGKELANTPGAVVFRNELFELIQYHPAGKKVHAMPLVIMPPWINKFYIMDLGEKKSMVRHLVREGFTVFMMSWKNPGADMADSTFEKYLLKGMAQAIEVARAISASPKVHAVGYCIGGTALTALMALFNRKYKPAQVPVAHWTLLASLADFSRPGEIEAFINDNSLATIDALMEKQGFLDKKQLSSAFRMLRPNSLIWHYVVHKYLYGETPPSLDVLYWNADSTRLPRAMHTFCLRQFYVANNLAKKDAIVLDGHKIDLSRITQPLYSVGTTEDHITPWAGTFKTAALVKGPVRYALSTSGHILGIINPPSPASRRYFWAGDASGRTDSKTWLDAQEKRAGSWWDDWCDWLRAGCGPLQAPPPAGLPDYPVLGDAPGTYVRET